MNNIERPIVAKIGGESQVTPDGVRAAMDYLQSNQDIHYLVPSAIGGNPKVTHLLVACAPEWEEGHPYNVINREVRTRFPSTDQICGEVSSIYTSMGNELGYYGMPPLLEELGRLISVASRAESEIERERYRHLIVSRGEWLSGHMWAELLGWRFVDPADVIILRKDGRLNKRSYDLIAKRLRTGGDRFVVPGFYGRGPDGAVRLLPKNGSDLTGAYISCGVHASEYQNFKNVPGVMSADPKVVDTPHKRVARLIPRMTYLEYGELGYGGFQVLHKDSITPVARLGIPVRVLNPKLASDSEYQGTLICADRSDEGRDVIGIAGKSGYVAFRIRKDDLEFNKGIARRILQIFEMNGVSISHIPTGRDSMAVVFEEAQPMVGYKIIDDVRGRIDPDEWALQRKIGTFAVVGESLRYDDVRTRVASRLFSALNEASIDIRGGTLAFHDISITCFVKENALAELIKVIHKALIED